ncbi:c-type cytochrome [Neomegalonema sp.]|uniref:c-type cytochrome n=1 Tax=Neomegalonema sp. TaxID=2039713 RepID=UPI0026274A75|nr:c-type cytochrome [Neomegalonema sp.]MDD2868420.1 c-type cytochrome [Neomegalonema sp.]
MSLEELALAGLRGLHLGGLAGAAGAFVVGVLAAEGGTRARLAAWARPLLWAALIFGALWFAVQAQILTRRGWPEAQLLMLTETGFGRIMALRLALTALALVLPRGAQTAILAAILAALALQPLLGHGAATPWLTTLAGALHVLAGALWAGSLPWLLWTLRRDPEAGLKAARRFSPLGVGLVATLGLGLWGLWPLTGGIPGILGTDYGRALLIKAGLLALMLACAFANGIWLAPAGRRRLLRLSLCVEALAGILVVLVAAWLALQPPGLHDRVVWPFERQPAPGLREDAFLRDRLLRMILPGAAAAGLVLAALALLRQARWIALALLLTAGFLLWRTPVFPAAPFLRPALPTSFQTAETRRNPASLQQGEALYLRDCASCHGPDARGAGPQATGDPVWPPDLTAPWFLQTRDGDWFWRIRHGMTSREGAPSMPGFPGLSDAEIWRLVDHLRGRASARSLDRRGSWGIPPQAPALRLRCAGESRRLDLSRPPGGALLYWGSGEPPAGVLRLDPEACGGLGPEMRAALALLTGGELPASPEFLIDGEGFLRWFWPQRPEVSALAGAAEWTRANPAKASGGHH